MMIHEFNILVPYIIGRQRVSCQNRLFVDIEDTLPQTRGFEDIWIYFFKD